VTDIASCPTGVDLIEFVAGVDLLGALDAEAGRHPV
jgi:hypothetical protein